MKPSMLVVVIKCLVSLSAMMILVTALHPQHATPLPPPRVSDSPPPSPPPQHPPNCDDKCSTQCDQNGIFRRMLCYVMCMAECTILPYSTTNQYKEHIDGTVKHGYKKCN
ncbi:hypothetical protein PIB30_039124 [Stylosanthes scabra]|uniref:Uncharacterized protein n=1 Tax=Stylosanthes scabra TaxID=79078 RepID=A0ABU6REC4_9FABA|nr:hypothetical protein [Stylosanthes scabra]